MVQQKLPYFSFNIVMPSTSVFTYLTFIKSDLFNDKNWSDKSQDGV